MPQVILFADVLGGFGGIETYLDTLARRLYADGWNIRIAVSLNDAAPFLDDLHLLGIPVYRQPRVPGDRWQVRQRLLVNWVSKRLRPGDWVYCVRQPMPETFLSLVRAAHRRGGKVAASWMFAPEYLPAPPGRLGESFRQAIAETDAVISVAECSKRNFRSVYNYTGPVEVVRYHCRETFPAPVATPPCSPYQIGFLGRVDIYQKNLDTILHAFNLLRHLRDDFVFNVYGGGPDVRNLATLANTLSLGDRVILHGPYDHRTDLPPIVAANHFFLYASRFEGGPCLSLLELLQAGRFVVASPVGGIPDIYNGRPNAGELVNFESPNSIADALQNAIERVAQGSINGQYIRSVFESEFAQDIAHEQWLEALKMRQNM